MPATLKENPRVVEGSAVTFAPRTQDFTPRATELGRVLAARSITLSANRPGRAPPSDRLEAEQARWPPPKLRSARQNLRRQTG